MGSMAILKTKWGQFSGAQIPECAHCGEERVSFLRQLPWALSEGTPQSSRVLMEEESEREWRGQELRVTEHFLSARYWDYTHTQSHVIFSMTSQ